MGLNPILTVEQISTVATKFAFLLRGVKRDAVLHANDFTLARSLQSQRWEVELMVMAMAVWLAGTQQVSYSRQQNRRHNATRRRSITDK